MTIKPIHQKQFPRRVLLKKCSQKFRKTDLCRTRTQMFFCQFCKTFQNNFFIEHLRWLFLPVLKQLDSQRQWCNRISELFKILLMSTLLVLVGIFVFIFGKHKLSVASHKLSVASLTFDIINSFWQRRIEVSWYLDYLISFCVDLYHNNHRITSILLSLRSPGLEKVEI